MTVLIILWQHHFACHHSRKQVYVFYRYFLYPCTTSQPDSNVKEPQEIRKMYLLKYRLMQNTTKGQFIGAIMILITIYVKSKLSYYPFHLNGSVSQHSSFVLCDNPPVSKLFKGNLVGGVTIDLRECLVCIGIIELKSESPQ